MTIHVVEKTSEDTAARKIKRGRCITLNCRRPAAKDRFMCNTCRDRAWRAAHPENHLWKNLKASARKRGLPFNLTLEEFMEFCRENNFVARVGRGSDDATVDRRDPREGYSKANLRVLSGEENARLGRALVGSGHRTPGQTDLPIESAHYAPEDDPFAP